MGANIVNGVVTNSLGGVQVLFDGIAAPLLCGPTQINAVVRRRCVDAKRHGFIVTPTEVSTVPC